MANNNNEGAENNLDNSKDSGLDKSFVGKFVTGLINNTPLSKWFGKDSTTTKSVVRRRDDEDDEDDASYVFQPPVKRAKLPSNSEHNNYSAHVFESPVTVHNASNNVNNVSSSKVYGKFPEPAAGPSGIRSRKLFEKHGTSVSTDTISNSFDNQDVNNGDNDSDSEASTSGYSSAPKLSQEKSKQSFNTSSTETSGNPPPRCRSLFTSTTDPSPSRSLFAERSPQMNTSLSSRRPAFNASTFGSPSFIDKTLSTRRILDSPFYSGSTIYGGASAYGRRLGKHGEVSNNNGRVSVQIKPVNVKTASDNSTLSKTARRILTTLEQYSTPISDAKKIPVTPKRQGILLKYVGATPYLTRDRKRASNRELQVPTVPELLQMKQKERLQNSTESVRQIATSSKSTLNKDEYKLRTEDDSSSSKQKHCNKMKNNVISVRQKAQHVDELVEEVKLPKVSLPITTLPKFDFVMMTSQSSTTSPSKPSIITTVGKPTAAVVELKKQEKIAENGKINHFTFSEPLVIAKDLSVSAINCFKFSEPLCKKQSLAGDNNNFKAGDNKNIFGGLKTKNNGESVIKSTGGSVVNVPGKRDEATSIREKPKQSATWECDTCLVKNDMDKARCVACDEPKPEEGQREESEGFGDQFKLSSDQWECSSCMLRNSNTDKNCIACANPKPDGDCQQSQPPQIGFGDKFKPPASSWECTSCLIRNKNELNKCAACGVAKEMKPAQTTASWGDKFKPSGDTWECDSCMLRNKNELDKCQACEAPKAGAKVASNQTFAFGDKFKAPPETWECPTCMIRNKNELTKCSACETVKPGHKLLLPSSTTGSSSSMFSFGIKPLEWECKTCLIKNKNDSSKCAACGISKDAPKPEKLKGFGEAFKAKDGEWECSSCLVRNKPGIDACACCGVSRSGASDKSDVNKEAEKKPVISFNFGINKSSPVQFKFGIPATKQDEESRLEVVVVSSSSSVAPPPASTTTTTTPVPAFVFGDVAKTTVTSSSSSTFSFGMNTQEKIEPAKSITSTSETITPTVVNNNNPLLKPTEKLPEKAAPAPVGFKFGLDSSNFSHKNDSQQKPVSSENLVTSTSKTETPVFSSRFEPSKPTPTFQFKPAAAINGDINKPKEALFAANKPAESNPFGNASIPATFKFNPPQPAAENTAPGLAATQIEAKAPIFKFGGGDPQGALKKTFGEASDGAVSNGFASPPKIPAFGSPQGFGATSKPFSFGASTDSTPKNPNFSFGQLSAKPSSVNPPVFSFGGGASSTPSTAGFNFSASSTSTGFDFGGAGAKVESQAPQPFGAPAPAPAPAPASSVFGAGVATAAGGKNGSFNFGTNANNNNQKAIFSFGASQTNQPSFGTPPPPTQSGFNFGPPAPPTIPPTGGFTFTGAQPSFNFTDGSTSGVPPQRKIKKALRRTHR